MRRRRRRPARDRRTFDVQIIHCTRVGHALQSCTSAPLRGPEGSRPTAGVLFCNDFRCGIHGYILCIFTVARSRQSVSPFSRSYDCAWARGVTGGRAVFRRKTRRWFCKGDRALTASDKRDRSRAVARIVINCLFLKSATRRNNDFENAP